MKEPLEHLTRADLAHRVVILDQQGLSQRAIARSLGISRNTVKVILAGHTSSS
jgi:DNA-binding NarL/FixJ family response regulator